MKTPSIRNILVPIDFSPMSLQAIDTAKAFAQRFGATVHLAHVHQFYCPVEFSPPMPPMIPYSTYTYDEAAEKRAAHNLALLATKHALSATRAHLLVGASAFDEICRLAHELRVDLIVTPTHGWTGLKHVLLGSTAERIVQHSPCPVLVSRKMKRPSKKGTNGPINTIVVPVDFSDCSLRGLNYAIGFAKKLAAKIVILHAVELGWAYTSDGYGMYDLSDLIDSARREGERQMHRFLDRVKFSRVPFETIVTTEPPIEAICSAAKSYNVDLVIMSTHGRTGLSHVLVGSVAEKIVRFAPCPVLVVPSHPEVRIAHLVKQPQSVRRARQTNGSRALQPTEIFTRRYRKLGVNPFPERRKTNKFRESRLRK